MPLEARKFIFTVSLCAMLAANPVLATAPTNDEELGTTHDVYVESTLNQATNGIAGVSYVNRMVNAAGNAADAAEAHAAAAGAHALSAAQSADEAHKVLEDKVNLDQGEDKKNLAMVTDDKGTVYPGYITNDMIAEKSVSATNKLHAGNYNEFKVLKAGFSGLGANPKYITTEWGFITKENIADDAVTTEKIADDSIHLGKLRYSNAYASGSVSDGIPLTTDGGTGLALSQISSVGIANGAVGADKLSVNGESSSTGFLAYTGSVDDGEKMVWRMVKTEDIADGAVTEDNIADGAVTESKIDAKTVDVLGPGSAGILVMISGASNNNIQWLGATGAAVMKADKNGVVEWGQLGTDGIANGAVTIDKTAGVVGMVPVGGEGATTYGSFWIE